MDVRKPARPSALASVEDIRERCKGRKVAIFLDYDGTLVPIVDTPRRAVMSQEMRRVVEDLSLRCFVGIISGRDLDGLRRLVDLDSVAYAGSHGFDMCGPGWLRVHRQVGVEFLPDLDEAARKLSADLGNIPGINVERKRFAIAVHYRQVSQERVPWIEETVDAVVSLNSRLRKTGGKKVFELRPAINWHKGKALLWLLGSLNLDGSEVTPLYIGDDVTDEDVFREIRGWGIGIVIQEVPSETAASYSLQDTREVQEFLEKFQPFCEGRER